MLKGTTSISLTYQSMINGVPAIYMTASIPDSGKSTVSKNITNLDLYDANKEECRKDMSDFDELVWSLEDQDEEAQSGSSTEATDTKSTVTDDTFGGMTL